jgi:prepilin-type processing-associated H-X9-DG protein
MGCSTRALNLFAAAAGVAALGIVILILWPLEAGERNPLGTRCLSNLRQLSLGMLMYESDWDGLPRRDQWMDRLLPYIKQENIIFCPALRDEHSEHGWFGYAMNSVLSGKSTEKLKQPEREPLVYDSINLARNASDPVLSLIWPGRHEGANNVAFADGHVRSFKTD